MSSEIIKLIGGEVIYSDSPNAVLKKWRTFFSISQTEVAEKLKVSPSVICDYESGRRKSPGINVVKKIITALVEIDAKNSGKKLSSLKRIVEKNLPAGTILDLREFQKPVNAEKICSTLKSRIYAGGSIKEKKVYGYTLIDSVRAITDLSSEQLIKVFGNTPERCLIFTNSHSGKSIMIALKTVQALGKIFKPTLIILHGCRLPDELALKIAEEEGIILATNNLKKTEEIEKKLAKII